MGGGAWNKGEKERGGPPPPADKCPLWLNCYIVLARCFALQQRRKRRLHYVIAFFSPSYRLCSSPLFRVCVHMWEQRISIQGCSDEDHIYLMALCVRTYGRKELTGFFYFVFFREDGCSGHKKFLLAEMQFFPFFWSSVAATRTPLFPS